MGLDRVCAARGESNWVVRPAALRVGSFRLRLHTGLRQRGRLLRSGCYLARLKPCPFEGSLGWEGVGGGLGVPLMMVGAPPLGNGGSITHISEARCGAPRFEVWQMWATRPRLIERRRG